MAGKKAFIENNKALLELIETQIAMHIAYVMTENDDKQMRSYDSFFPALKNLHISTPNSFSRGGGGHDNLLGTDVKQSSLSPEQTIKNYNGVIMKNFRVRQSQWLGIICPPWLR